MIVSGVGVLILFLAFFGIDLNSKLFLGLSISLMLIGTFLFTYYKYAHLPEGVKNNGVWFDSMSSKGVIGWIFGSCDGRYILDHLAGEDHAARIVVYTGDASQTVPTQVMTHGGAAFVSKSEQPTVLLDTIAAVAAGRMVFPYIAVRTLYDNPLTTLTRRELEVLSDLASGRTNKQIARDLGVSLNTVKFHVRNLFQKLGVNSRSQAIAMYLRS